MLRHDVAQLDTEGDAIFRIEGLQPELASGLDPTNPWEEECDSLGESRVWEDMLCESYSS